MVVVLTTVVVSGIEVVVVVAVEVVVVKMVRSLRCVWRRRGGEEWKEVTSYRN
jgi:hypothetical protein